MIVDSSSRFSMALSATFMITWSPLLLPMGPFINNQNVLFRRSLKKQRITN